ncbi:GNAT family N-acetyltransferase [Alienimonas sp. DA493]|uniref:GNAT family N-acetyltransferase n=1 Tax=Alienimonas sp. DA493 TaxID=3373605 RepID=UPI0037543EE4
MVDRAAKTPAALAARTTTREPPGAGGAGTLSSARLLRWYAARRKAGDLPGMAAWAVSSPGLARRAAGKAGRLAVAKVRPQAPGCEPDVSQLATGAVDTDRLVLRPLAAEDLVPLARIFPSAELGQPWPGRSPAPTWWAELGFVSDLANNAFSWTVAKKADGARIGVCAVGWYAVEGYQGAELGYWVGADHRGAGYATEAAQAAFDQCRRHLGLDRVAAFIAPENFASVRVAEKIGLRFQRRITFRGGTAHLYDSAEPASA